MFKLAKTYVGIDLGATWVRVALSNDKGEVTEREKFKTPNNGVTLLNKLREVITKLTGNLGDLEAIGIGSIGPLDLKQGMLKNPPNTRIKDLPIVEYLSEKFKVPVYLVNDCSAGVLGEKFYGDGIGKSNIFYLTISTGIGGGAIVDDHLIFGKDGNAPEIGHVIVDTELDIRCGCGGIGHWEGLASGSNIPKFVNYIVEKLGRGVFERSELSKASNGEPLGVTAKILYDAARGGDKLARLIVDKLNLYHAIGVAEIVNVFDPEIITVGGSIALNNWDLIEPNVVKNVEKYVINKLPVIKLTKLKDDVVLLGAIALAMHPEYIPQIFKNF